MFAVILAIGLLLAINFSSRITEGQPIQEAYERVQEEITALKLEQARLVAERDYVRSDAYVERWARDDGRMVRAGEVLVVPVPSSDGLEPTPIPEVSAQVETAPPPPDPWRLWWALFFDGTPPQF
jgi:cell division protein FtsB